MLRWPTMTPITCSRQSLPHSMRRGGSICRLLVCSVSQGRPRAAGRETGDAAARLPRTGQPCLPQRFSRARRDQDHRGKVAMPLEYRAPAWIARLQASGSGSLHPRVSSADSSTTWASNAVRAGNTTSIAPTIKMGRHRGPMDKAAGRRSGFRRPATTPRRRVRVRRIPALHIPARRALGRQRREPRARPASPLGRMPACRPCAVARWRAGGLPIGPRAWKAFSHGFPCRYGPGQAAPRSPPRDPCGAACRCDG
ncbi:hypothetical protein SAMN04244548_05227 [Paracoccus pantotrophus]|nr:hypothetical protein SAMN04244548_05227 [Paracoccus pantotrophus]